MKQSRISITTNLPEDPFDEAETLTKIRPILAAAREALTAAGLDVTIAHDLVTPRAPKVVEPLSAAVTRTLRQGAA